MNRYGDTPRFFPKTLDHSSRDTPYGKVHPTSQKDRFEHSKEVSVLVLGTEMFTGPSMLGEKCIWWLLNPAFPFFWPTPNILTTPFQARLWWRFSKKASHGASDWSRPPLAHSNEPQSPPLNFKLQEIRGCAYGLHHYTSSA